MLKAKTRQELLQGYDYVDKISLVQSMSDSHIRVLRDDIDEWKLIVPKLGLEAKEVELIDQQEQRDTMKRHAALHKWKRKLGKRATYLCFLNACMQVNDIALAERMLDLLNEHMKANRREYSNTSSRLYHDRSASQSDRDGEQDILSLSHTSISSRGSSIGDWLPAEQRVEELKMKYKYTIEVITEYFERNISSDMTVKMLLLVPPELKQLKSYLNVTTSDGKDIFSELVDVCDYRHHELLQQLVDGMGDENCKRAMSLYYDDLNRFNSETTLGEFAKDLHGTVTYSRQEKVVLKMGVKWENKTLQDFEEFQKKLQRKAHFGAHSLQMRKVETACVQITLAIVSELADISDLKFVEPEFFKANSVLQVSINDCIVYDVESQKHYEFVNAPPTYFICPIAKQIMLDPQKTLCCNKHISKTTIGLCRNQGHPCPFCFSAAIEFRADKSLQEKTKGAKIYCPYKHEGCHWEGEIRHVAHHLHAEENCCLHSLTKCPYSCGASTQRHSREKHLETCKVYNTPLQCQYCRLEYPRSESHEDVCPNIPVRCPYKCGKWVERSEVKVHLKVCYRLQTKKKQKLPEEQIDNGTTSGLKDHASPGLSAVTNGEKDDEMFRPAGYKLLDIAKKMLTLRSKLPDVRLSLLETRIELKRTELNACHEQNETGRAQELESKDETLKQQQTIQEAERIEKEIRALRQKLLQAHKQITLTSYQK